MKKTMFYAVVTQTPSRHFDEITEHFETSEELMAHLRERQISLYTVMRTEVPVQSLRLEFPRDGYQVVEKGRKAGQVTFA